jgi:hypothetical protein
MDRNCSATTKGGSRCTNKGKEVIFINNKEIRACGVHCRSTNFVVYEHPTTPPTPVKLPKPVKPVNSPPPSSVNNDGVVSIKTNSGATYSCPKTNFEELIRFMKMYRLKRDTRVLSNEKRDRYIEVARKMLLGYPRIGWKEMDEIVEWVR